MKQYNGVDILKFVMALIVVMIHVKPNIHSNELFVLFKPLTMVAVPVFFVISSVLIFNKLNNGNNGALLKYCKRIGILYLCWLIIDSWFVFTHKSYFTEGWIRGFLDFIKDVFFATTFPGSWFLSASVIGVVLVYYMSQKVNSFIVFLLCLLMYLYVCAITQLPAEFKTPYKWYAEHVREEVHLSFPAQMIWISLGQLISKKISWLQSVRNVYPISVWISCVSFFLLMLTGNQILKIVVVLMFVITAYLVNIPNKPIYKRIRNYSILVFFFHFCIAGKMNRFCNIVGDSLLTNWLYYILVVIVSITFAEAVLRLEQHRGFSYLKYLH